MAITKTELPECAKEYVPCHFSDTDRLILARRIPYRIDGYDAMLFLPTEGSALARMHVKTGHFILTENCEEFPKTTDEDELLRIGRRIIDRVTKR